MFQDAEQAQFLRSALKLYHSLQGASDELVVELLTQYIEGDTLHQNFIRNLMAEVGLKVWFISFLFTKEHVKLVLLHYFYNLLKSNF